MTTETQAVVVRPVLNRPLAVFLSIAVAVLSLIVLAGCSTVGGSTDAGPQSVVLDTAMIGSGFEGDFDSPPASGPEAQRGKTVWYISCGQSYIACSRSATDFQQAGSALGWNVTVVDGKADPSAAANLIRQGIAAGADGIALMTYDCPGIKNALIEARTANVPVVNFGSMDCDDPAFGGREKLFTASLNIRGSDNQCDFWTNYAKARADYALAALGGQPGQIIHINETSQRGHQCEAAGFVAQVGNKCPDCIIVDTPFTFAQVPTKANEIFRSAITRNPEAKVVSFPMDSLMQLGLQTVLDSSGRTDLTRVGAEGAPPNLELIREGKQDSATVFPLDWYNWGLADTLNRLFANDTKMPSEGGGYIQVDRTHNLPADDNVELPIDFKAAYQNVWSGDR
ncbi:sugar ABC transporter substrate-binding protein [Rhodococcus sp. IEGM 248]|jgi:ribose transport system substrate-binding protein|nr:sugar ABC transporter substrate-binding protein [Rhodococcus sp. IEGM 248]